ncbi:cysteine-rich repeat secretory protein 55-like [Phalaenopsis equestris]|nr:cysteine-rich repeat secretory protein 55-like [Phalaenopsis equestris]
MQLLFLFLVFFPIATLSTELVLYQQCEKNFTEKYNMLQTNINNILLDMVATSSLNGYAISSYASDSYKPAIYGVTRCQGDVSRQTCSECITSAAQQIRSACPNAAQARGWYEHCYLHYDTENFIGKLDKAVAYLSYSFERSANLTDVQRAAGELLEEVSEATASGSEKFGYGESYVDESLTVYGMAQCTRDLGERACSDCLDYAFRYVSFYCGTQTGCRVIGGGCEVRFEIYKFLFLGDSTIGAPAPAPSIVAHN